MTVSRLACSNERASSWIILKERTINQMENDKPQPTIDERLAALTLSLELQHAETQQWIEEQRRLEAKQQLQAAALERHTTAMLAAIGAYLREIRPPGNDPIA